jgi:hypothetical protein
MEADMPGIRHDLSFTSYGLIGLGALGYEIVGLEITLMALLVLMLVVVAASLIAALAACIRDERRCCASHGNNCLPPRTSGDAGVRAQ